MSPLGTVPFWMLERRGILKKSLMKEALELRGKKAESYPIVGGKRNRSLNGEKKNSKETLVKQRDAAGFGSLWWKTRVTASGPRKAGNVNHPFSCLPVSSMPKGKI